MRDSTSESKDNYFLSLTDILLYFRWYSARATCKKSRHYGFNARGYDYSHVFLLLTNKMQIVISQSPNKYTYI